MGSTHQPLACVIEKTVGLVIHFHRHMGATVQVSMHDTVVTDGKRTAGLSCINHIEGYRQTALLQV